MDPNSCMCVCNDYDFSLFCYDFIIIIIIIINPRVTKEGGGVDADPPSDFCR